ncbi:penicillin acylase family protein [Saccharopolyspora hirsuta]|nr:penicillin acylase family protein [Saccharopolyspora hirsuta]
MGAPHPLLERIEMERKGTNRMGQLRGRRRAGRALAGVLVLVLTAFLGASQAAATGTERATIRYTEYGIPHVVADDYAGLGYGYAYAAARDNICLIAEAYVTVDAERSRYFGPDAPGNPALGRASTSANSDAYYQYRKDTGAVERLVGQAPPIGPEPEVAEFVRGYVAGYNRFLRDTGRDGITDPACRGAEWVRPIDELDVYRHVNAVATAMGSGVAIDGISTARPAPAGVLPEVPTHLDLFPAEKSMGSNAIAVGADGTRGGGGVLLGNPHFYWQGALRFWQSQLTIPGEVNVSGASLLGFPGIQIGHNQDVAWSHTVSTAATFGLFELPLAPGSPTTYLVDGRAREMTPVPVSFDVRRPDGTIGREQRTIWTTPQGPVVTQLGNVPLPWASSAHVLRDANATNLRALNTWFDLARAGSTEDVSRALAASQGMPWVNTIATDRAGNALYSDVQAVPHVTDELAADCSTPLGSQVFPSSGIPVLDGGRSECEWGSDPAAVEPGLLGPAQLPELTRRDYVLNANDSPWLTNPEAPLADYPRVVGDVATERSARTREAIRTVERRLSGTDGLPERGFSAEDMKQVLFADHSRVAELAAADTARMCAAFPGGRAPSSSGPVDVSAACPALADWGHDFRLDSRGSLLFERFVAQLAEVPTGPWRTPFDPVDPVNTPNTLAVENPAVQTAFGDAAAELQTAGIPLDAPLGEYQHVTRNGEQIPVHGAPHQTGVLNVLTPHWDPAAGNTEVTHGSSFLQVVQFDAGESPRASTLLTYSQSADPTSPHYADQTRLFSAGQWVPARFGEREIAASPVLRVEVISER